MKRSRATLLAAVALACCTATPAHAADAVLSPAPGAAGLTAYGGHVVWSSRDPVSGRWSLTQLHRGAVSALPVAPRSVPFDADAGSDADGNAVVVYSRCATEPSPPSGLSPGADWMTASGCDIYQTRLDGAGGEIRLDRVNSRDGSETTPSIWRGTVAFARRARGGHVAKLLLRRPSDRTPTRLGGGSIQLCYPGCPGAHPTAGPESLDLTGSNVTYVWRMTGGQTYGVGPVWELRVARTDGMPALHADGGLISGTCGYRLPFAATVTGRTLRYAVAGGECDTSFTHFATYDLSTGARSEADPAPGVINGMAVDGGVTYWLRGVQVPETSVTPLQGCANPLAACLLMASDGFAYQPARARRQGPEAQVSLTSEGYRWVRGPAGSRLLRPPATIACLPGRAPIYVYANARRVRTFSAALIDRSGHSQSLGQRSKPLSDGVFAQAKLRGCGRTFHLRYVVDVGGRRQRATLSVRVLAPRR